MDGFISNGVRTKRAQSYARSTHHQTFIFQNLTQIMQKCDKTSNVCAKQSITLLIVAVILVSGCVSLKSPTGDILLNETLLNGTEAAAIELAKLNPLDVTKVESFEQYHKFADGFNAMAKIFNEKMDVFDIPYFEPTQDGYEKASKFITEYTPLIDNYNNVILSAKDFNKNDKARVDKFYAESGQFAFESAVIVGMVFASASYMAVGTVYRASGLNAMAFKCGACVSVILQESHWAIRTVLVEGSSQAAQTMIELVEKTNNIGK